MSAVEPKVLLLVMVGTDIFRHFHSGLEHLLNVWNPNPFPLCFLTAPLSLSSLFLRRSNEGKEALEDWGSRWLWSDHTERQAVFWHSNVTLRTAANPSCVRKDATMCTAFNWISSGLDRREDGATRAFDITRWQFIWAATTGSETQFSMQLLLLDQEMGGWKVQCLYSMKDWRPTEQQLVKQVI